MTNGHNFMKLNMNLYDHSMDFHIKFCQNGFNNLRVIALEMLSN